MINIPESLKMKRGVFVVLKNKEEISMGYLTKSIAEATIDSALAAAARASRQGLDLSQLNIEINILGPLNLIKTKRASYPEQLEIGKDGLFVERGYQRALILPRIAKKKGWDGLDFLAECCIKAGLSPDA